MGVTPAESRIMDALWSRSPMTADELKSSVGAAENWGDATVRTLVSRLLRRRAIRSERIDGRVRYLPVLTRADYVQGESQALLDRLFGGSLTPLVAHFADHRRLTTEELARLKTLIESLDDNAG